MRFGGLRTRTGCCRIYFPLQFLVSDLMQPHQYLSDYVLKINPPKGEPRPDDLGVHLYDKITGLARFINKGGTPRIIFRPGKYEHKGDEFGWIRVQMVSGSDEKPFGTLTMSAHRGEKPGEQHLLVTGTNQMVVELFTAWANRESMIQNGEHPLNGWKLEQLNSVPEKLVGIHTITARNGMPRQQGKWPSSDF